MNEAMEQIRKLSEEISKLTNIEAEGPQKVICPISDKDFLTTNEAAAYLSVSPGTLQKWREMGLKVIKLGDGRTDKLFYSKTSINEFLKSYEC